MKRRAFKVLNFFAFNLLFFALYLNFIHKDKNVQKAIQASNAASFAATVSLENEEAGSEKAGRNKGKSTATVSTKTTATALRSSFN
ncbi:MAG TPA: hypothetical protein VM935_12320 [Chitinophagaceae bacterium]|jgi:hypothetical protein|nr:hypothetical protein [Chitinophagaceae bacterium]